MLQALAHQRKTSQGIVAPNLLIRRDVKLLEKCKRKQMTNRTSNREIRVAILDKELQVESRTLKHFQGLLNMETQERHCIKVQVQAKCRSKPPNILLASLPLLKMVDVEVVQVSQAQIISPCFRIVQSKPLPNQYWMKIKKQKRQLRLGKAKRGQEHQSLMQCL